LGINGRELTVSVVTNGASASLSTSVEFIRVFRAYIDGVGTYDGNNTGDIVIETTNGTELITIAAGQGQTQHTAYTIPKGYIGYVMGVTVNVDSTKPADIAVYTRNDILSVNAKRLRYYANGLIGTFNAVYKAPIIEIDELTDIWCEGRGSNNNTEISASIVIYIFKK